MSDAAVSVAMATYNGARHLQRQLDSVSAQTLLPGELVVHDDGSRDGTLELVEAFARQCPFPVRIERAATRVGFADAFLRAATLCSGELVAFCDQDDVWVPEKLATVVEAMHATGVLLAVHTCSVVDDELRPLGRSFPRFDSAGVSPPLASDPWLPVPGMAMVFERRLLDAVDWRQRPPSHDLAGEPVRHDEWVYTLARALGSIAFLDQPLSLYRQHGENVTGAPLRTTAPGALSTGWSYYSARREQAQAWSSLFAGLAAREQDAARRARLDRAAESYGALVERLGRRLEVYEPGQSTFSRARRLTRLAVRGGYRSRRRGGFGGRGLLRDAAMVALRRVG